MERPVACRSYLLRVWPREVDGNPGCTVTLESVATGRRVTLPDLTSLVTFLASPVDDDIGSRTGRPVGRAGES
jgi:hypothetical protein